MASSSTSGAALISFRLSRSHCTSAPGDGDRALERVDRRVVADPVAGGGDQAVGRLHRLGAGVEEQEVAGAVGVLRLAHREAGLAEERRLLVAEVAGHRDALDGGDAGLAVDLARGVDLGQHRPRHADRVQQLVVPVERGQVHQQRAAGVGHVGDVQPAVDAAGQVPDDPGVHVAEQELARAGPGPRRPRRCRGSSAPWGRRSRSRSAGRSWPGSGPGRRRPSACCRSGRCGCPARRSRCRPPYRWCGPRRPRSRAGW